MTDATQSNPAAGILWMLATGICFVAVMALVKLLGARIPAPEAAFLRYLLGLVFLLPMLRTLRNTPVSRRLQGLFFGRGMIHALGVVLWFFAMTRIPIAEVTALNYLAPVYVTIGAALFLGEKLAIRRVMAVVAALAGAIIILRPGFREINSGHLAMLGTAVLFGGSYLLAKYSVGKANPSVVVAMLSLWVTLALAPFAAVVWVTPTPTELALLFGVACFATAGHFTMTLAFRAAPVTVTQPVTFLQLVWATLLGGLVFQESLDIWVVAGGSGILAAVTFITWRESVVRRKSITPPVPATKI